MIVYIISAIALRFIFLTHYSAFSTSPHLNFQNSHHTATMPPSRVGPSGHRRLRLDKMRSRGQAEQVRNPSPDIEEDEELRKEHFSYYNLMYSARKPKSEISEPVLFRDPFQEDRRNQNQMTLPIRRRRTSPFSSATDSPTSLPIHGLSISGRSSAVDTSYLGRNAQTHFGDLQETRRQTESDQQSPTTSDQSNISDGTRKYKRAEIFLDGLGQLTFRTSQGEYEALGVVISISKCGAINIRKVPRIEQLSTAAWSNCRVPSSKQLSTAVASDLRLLSSLQHIADSVINRGVVPAILMPGSVELEQPETDRREPAHQGQEAKEEGHKPDERKEEEQHEDEEDACMYPKSCNRECWK